MSSEIPLRLALAVCMLGLVVPGLLATEAVWSLWLQLLCGLGGLALAVVFFVRRRRRREHT